MFPMECVCKLAVLLIYVQTKIVIVPALHVKLDIILPMEFVSLIALL